MDEVNEENTLIVDFTNINVSQNYMVVENCQNKILVGKRLQKHVVIFLTNNTVP